MEDATHKELAAALAQTIRRALELGNTSNGFLADVMEAIEAVDHDAGRTDGRFLALKLGAAHVASLNALALMAATATLGNDDDAGEPWDEAPSTLADDMRDAPVDWRISLAHQLLTGIEEDYAGTGIHSSAQAASDAAAHLCAAAGVRLGGEST